MKDGRNRIISGVLFLILTAIFYWNGKQTLKAAAFNYPRYILIGLGICSIVLILQGIAKISRGDKAEETAVQPPADADAAENSPDALPDTIKPVITKETVVTLLVVCIAAIAYIMLINWIGYILSTVLFIAGVLVYLRVRKPWLVAAVSIGVTAFLYIMFNNILMVQLPVGRLLYNILYR